MTATPGERGQAREGIEVRRAPSAAVLRSKLRLQDLEVAGKRVLVRADLNVPVRAGAVADETRILASLPSLRHLQRAGAAVVLMSHRGRPKGKRVEELGMRPVAQALRRHLGDVVDSADDCIGPEVEAATRALAPGRILLLENLRFHAGETANDADFAAALGRLGDLYVDDAFGAAHRAHASIVGVAERMGVAAAGDLLQREVMMLSRVLVQPESPFVLILGGAKVKDKVGVIGNLLPLVDRILIGGAMANAFLAARGVDVGGSLAPAEAMEQARVLLADAESAGVAVELPSDLVAAPGIEHPDGAHIVEHVAADEMALDIGPRSAERFAAHIAAARTVVWNGPMGVFETSGFDAGTLAVARAIAAMPSGTFSVVGGGDTAAAASVAGIAERVSHVSTGGGAALDLLAGAILPGVAALTDRDAGA